MITNLSFFRIHSDPFQIFPLLKHHQILQEPLMDLCLLPNRTIQFEEQILVGLLTITSIIFCIYGQTVANKNIIYACARHLFCSPLDANRGIVNDFYS
jgi:hypothetical protein